MSLFVYFFGYRIEIQFDSTVSIPQQGVIQLVANYVLFNNTSGMIFIYYIWIMVSLIPDFLYNNFKKAYSMNLITFFFLNFFALTFLYQHSRQYFDSNFLFHLLNSILLGSIITIISLLISLFLKYINKDKTDDHLEDLHIVANQIKSKCPKCGIEFDSTPTFCYNCNTKLRIKPEEELDPR
ncbi:MAG: hypothetical protein ACW98D_13595 [Promethearchaeota archaeon]